MSIFSAGMGFLLAILLLSSWLLAQTKYDLVIRGGEVIDPRNGVRRVPDVGIRHHKIAAVEKDIPAAQVIKVIKARGLLVTANRKEMKGGRGPSLRPDRGQNS